MSYLLIGVFLLLLVAFLPFIGMLFPLFMFLPLVFMFKRPTVRVYRRGFGDDFNADPFQPDRPELSGRTEDSDIIDVEFTEKETRSED